jgi:hypothetical protein
MWLTPPRRLAPTFPLKGRVYAAVRRDRLSPSHTHVLIPSSARQMKERHNEKCEFEFILPGRSPSPRGAGSHCDGNAGWGEVTAQKSATA